MEELGSRHHDFHWEGEGDTNEFRHGQEKVASEKKRVRQVFKVGKKETRKVGPKRGTSVEHKSFKAPRRARHADQNQPLPIRVNETRPQGEKKLIQPKRNAVHE